jgi:hypothetical protein
MVEGRSCRFGFPKEPADITQSQGEICEYERGIADENINNYNPYFAGAFPREHGHTIQQRWQSCLLPGKIRHKV